MRRCRRDKARIGSFDGLRDESRRIVEDALIEAVRQPDRLDTPGKRLAAEYYASGMDLTSIEKRGLTSLAPLLSQIDALNDRSQLPAVAGKNGAVSNPGAIFCFGAT